MPTLKDVAKSLGLSPEWIKKMGREGVFDFIKEEPGTPGIPRELTEKEMQTVFVYASYRQAGYPLSKLKEHAARAKRLRDIFLKYKTNYEEPKNAFRTIGSVDYSIFDFIGQYQYPEKELTNIYPEELVNLSKEDLAEINELIAWFISETEDIKKLMQKERERLEMVHKLLSITEDKIGVGQARIKRAAQFFAEKGKE